MIEYWALKENHADLVPTLLEWITTIPGIPTNKGVEESSYQIRSRMYKHNS